MKKVITFIKTRKALQLSGFEKPLIVKKVRCLSWGIGKTGIDLEFLIYGYLNGFHSFRHKGTIPYSKLGKTREEFIQIFNDEEKDFGESIWKQVKIFG